MKRSLLLSLCAATVVALSCGQAMATVTLSLNLRYDDPNNEADGGSWDLLASDDSAFGISAVVAVLDNIDFNSITLNSGIGALPLKSKQSGTLVEFVYGQNPNGTTVGDVGKGTAGVADDLFASPTNPYNNFSLIASGTFGAVRPSFGTFPDGIGDPNAIGGPSDAAVWLDAAMSSAADGPETINFGIGNPANGGVRGDSVATDGLRPGDANRDGIVNLSDFTILGSPANYNLPGGWDQGDFNSDGQVGLSDFTILGSPANYNTSAASPAIGAVPEPSSIALVMFSLASLVGVRRR